MQEELQIVRDQVVATTYSSVNRVDAATTTSQEFQQHLDPQQQQQQCRQRFGRSVSSAAAVGASATAAAAAEAQGQAQAQAAAERRRAANLERALYCAEETRAAVESALREAEERLAAVSLVPTSWRDHGGGERLEKFSTVCKPAIVVICID